MLPVAPYPMIDTAIPAIPTRTYRLDTHTKRIGGFVDSVDAMTQAYYKLFNTERFAYEIYTTNFGIELERLIGEDTDFVIAVLETRIRDAIFADDRTVALQRFSVVQTSRDTLQVDAAISTTQGEIQMRKELRF